MNNNLEVINIDINEVMEYENNPRRNNSTIKKLENSIKEFGFNNPILIDDNNVIIAGHSRYKAAKNLGLNKIPCIRLELPEYKAKAYRIIDNKVGEFSVWDVQKLDEELESIIQDIDFDFASFDIDVSHLQSLDNEIIYKKQNKEYDINAFNNDLMQLSFQLSLNDFRKINRCLLALDKDINIALVKLVNLYDNA